LRKVEIKEKLKMENRKLGEANGKLRIIFLPAVGNRHFNTGIQNLQGVHGAYWSSTQFNSSSGYRLRLDSDGTEFILVGDSKTYGFSVRCVR